MRLENQSSTDKNRKRRIIGFNPPYSKSVSSNMGKCFLIFQSTVHKFRKLSNRNTVMVSYSCLPNNEETTRGERRCTCPTNVVCPMNGYCLEKNIRYLAHITSDLPNYVTNEYKGICATTWKERFGNHKKSFRIVDYETGTLWRLKRKECKHSITWQKDRNFSSYVLECMMCSLCMNEKLQMYDVQSVHEREAPNLPLITKEMCSISATK